MPKKKQFKDLATRIVSTEVSILNDRDVNEIKDKFNFLNEYNIAVELDYAVTHFHLISKLPKEPTPKQSSKRLSDIQNKIYELTDILSNISQSENILIMEVSENRPQKFSANDTIDYLNELSAQIEGAKSKLENVINKGGRPKITHQSVFLTMLYSVYKNGTGLKITCSYSELEAQYQSDFVRFCEYVNNIYALGVSNSAIGEFTQEKNKKEKLKKKSKTIAKKE